MKNTIKLIEAMRGIAVIVLITTTIIPMLACESLDKTAATTSTTAAPVIAADPSTITITGLEAYNGMFIMVKTRGLNPEGVRIANGSDLSPYDPDA